MDLHVRLLLFLAFFLVSQLIIYIYIVIIVAIVNIVIITTLDLGL